MQTTLSKVGPKQLIIARERAVLGSTNNAGGPILTFLAESVDEINF